MRSHPRVALLLAALVSCGGAAPRPSAGVTRLAADAGAPTTRAGSETGAGAAAGVAYRVTLRSGLRAQNGCPSCGGDGYMPPEGYPQPGGSLVAIPEGEGRVELWDFAAEVWRGSLVMGKNTAYDRVIWSDDGARVCLAYQSACALFEVATRRELARLTVAGDVLITQAGVIGVGDARAAVYDPTSGAELRGFAIPSRSCKAAGKLLACAAEKEVAIFDLERGARVGAIATKTNATFDVDGKRGRVAALAAGELSVWDAARGARKLASSSAPRSPDVSFSADGTAIGIGASPPDGASAGNEGTCPEEWKPHAPITHGRPDLTAFADVATGTVRNDPRGFEPARRYRFWSGTGYGIIDRATGRTLCVPHGTALGAPVAFADDGRALLLSRAIVDLERGTLLAAADEVRFAGANAAIERPSSGDARVVRWAGGVARAALSAKTITPSPKGDLVLALAVHDADPALAGAASAPALFAKLPLADGGVVRVALPLYPSGEAAFSADGALAAVGLGASAGVAVVETATGAVRCTVKAPVAGPFAFSSDGAGLFAGGGPLLGKGIADDLTAFDARTCAARATIASDRKPFLDGAAFGATDASQGALELFDASSGAKLPGCPRGAAKRVDREPSGPRLLCAAGAQVYVWDPRAKRELGDLIGVPKAALEPASSDELLFGPHHVVYAGDKGLLSWPIAPAQKPLVLDKTRPALVTMEGDALAAAWSKSEGYAFMFEVTRVRAWDDGGAVPRDVGGDAGAVGEYQGGGLPPPDVVHRSWLRHEDASPARVMTRDRALEARAEGDRVALVRASDGARVLLGLVELDAKTRGAFAATDEGAFVGDASILGALRLVSDAGDVKTATALRATHLAPSLLGDLREGRALPRPRP